MNEREKRSIDQLQFYLARLGRRLRLRDGWLLAQRSLWLAALGAALFQLAGRIWPVARLGLWTFAPLAAWLLVVPGLAILRPLPAAQIARRIDGELGLKERLSTAIFTSWQDEKPSNLGFQPALVNLQHQDALAAAHAIQPRQALPLRWLRRPLLLAALLTATAIALAVLPNPMTAVLQERAAVAQAAEEQAAEIEKLRQDIEQAQTLTPEEREELLRRLAELAEQLRANPGDRQEALADLSKVEEALRQKLDPNAQSRQAALEALAAQLQALAGQEPGDQDALSEAAEALEKLTEQLAEMDAAEREALAQTLAQMAARAAQAGDASLAQALSALAQATQTGDETAASQAAQAAADALAQAQQQISDQAALQQALAQLQASRQAVAQAGQSQGQATAQAPGQSGAQGQSQGGSQGNSQGQSPGQGQNQGGQPGGGGGTKADTLPPGDSTGQANRPQGEGQPGQTGDLDQVYVPWERRQGSDEEFLVPGQDSGEGETQVREQQDPLPGAPGEALVPYHQVYYTYLDTANQTLERSYIPTGLKDYVRAYFSQLEP